MHRRSLSAVVTAAGLFAVQGFGRTARADESRPDLAAPAATVVAPAGSPGVTVVATTPGGESVTATGCQQVMVNGAPTVVTTDGAPCPTYAPSRAHRSNDD